MLYVTRIKSPLKGEKDIELFPLTLVYGPNGSGKSSVTESVRLALCGQVRDISGRREGFRLAGEIMRLMPPHIVTARVQAELSNGLTAVWESTRTESGGATRPKHQIPDISIRFPVQEVADNLCGSSDVARKYLLMQAGASISRADVLTRLSESLRERYMTEAREFPTVMNEVDVLQMIATRTAETVTRLKNDQKDIENARNALAATLSAMPLESDIAQAQARAQEAKTRLMQFQHLSRAFETRRRALSDAQTAQTELESLIRSRNAMEAELAALPPPLDPVTGAVRTVLEATMRLTAGGRPVCLTCMGRTNIQSLAAIYAGLPGADANPARRSELTARLNALAGKLEKTAADLLAANSLLASTPEPFPMALSFEQINAEHLEASERLQALQGVVSQWKSVADLRRQAAEQEERVRSVTAFATALDEVVASLVDVAIRTFVARVQKYLPETDRFDLRIGDRRCEFGFIKNGVLETALSGAAWSRVTLAIAAAIIEDTKDGLIIITPYEERAYSPESLREMMIALNNANAQVIIESTVLPRGAMPKGWKKVVMTVPEFAKGEEEEIG